MKISVTITVDGVKPDIYAFKKNIEQFLQQYSCHYTAEVKNEGGEVETMSAMTISIPVVQAEDIIDAEITGEEALALLEMKDYEANRE